MSRGRVTVKKTTSATSPALSIVSSSGSPASRPVPIANSVLTPPGQTQGFEETVIDMYSAVRHGYLQRREQLIKE